MDGASPNRDGQVLWVGGRVLNAMTVDVEEYFQVEAEEIEEVNDRSTEVEALMRSVVSTFDNYARLNKKMIAASHNEEKAAHFVHLAGQQA